MPYPTDVAAVVEAVRATNAGSWDAAPAGWPGEVEAALIDAVMSIRATYGGPGSGVRAAVARWREHRGGGLVDDLTVLGSMDPDTLADVLRNRQRLSGNTLKAAGIVEASTRLLAAGVHGAGDLSAESRAQREAVTGVVGLGPITWGYLTLLLEAADEPADPRITSFVGACVGRQVAPGEAHDLLATVAAELGTSPVAITHALWRQVRSG